MQLTEYESVVEVKRDGIWRNVGHRMLVPGDVVKVKSDWKLPCDLLILQGTMAMPIKVVKSTYAEVSFQSLIGACRGDGRSMCLQ